MALQSPPSAKQPSTGEHHRAEELQKGGAVAFMVLTFNSGLAAYLLWGDVACVASVGVTYVLLVPVFVRRFGWWDPGTHHHGGSSFWIYVFITILLLSLPLGVFLASRLARTAAPSTSTALLVAAAAMTALGLGGLCSYLLHRRSSSKQERQKMILPLMQESSR